MSTDKKPVSLEDLLRLKRLERPPAEFWNDFDRRLRAKQLAALVEKRPWWHGLRALSRVGRYHVAFGGAAIFAITFVSLRQNNSTVDPSAGTVQSTAATPAEPSVVATMSANTSTSVTAPHVAAGAGIARSVTEASSTDGDETSAVSAHEERDALVVSTSQRSLGAPNRFARDLGSVSSLEALTGATRDRETMRPSERFIAANFAAAQAGDAGAVPLLANPQGFESRAVPVRSAAIDPLQNMTPPGESRRSSLHLTALVTAGFDDTSVRTTERAANRISPEELYDQVRRIGTRRGGFNVKF